MYAVILVPTRKVKLTRLHVFLTHSLGRPKADDHMAPPAFVLLHQRRYLMNT